MFDLLAWYGIVDRDMIMVWATCGLIAAYLHKKISVLIPAVVFGPLSFLLFPPE